MFFLFLQIFKMNFLSDNFVHIYETFRSHRSLHPFLLILFPHTSTVLFDLQVPIPLPHFFVLSLFLHCNPLSSIRAACLGIGAEIFIRAQLSSDCITEDKDFLSPSSSLLPLATLGGTRPVNLSCIYDSVFTGSILCGLHTGNHDCVGL